jgi:hypothetical protein
MAATRLFSTTSVEEQWRGVAGPWLRDQANAAWRNPLPTVVLTPSRAESFYLRSRLVGKGVPFLGLRFWTPSDARKFLLGRLSSDLTEATLPELRLLARASAEKLRHERDAAAETLASVVREPGPFLRAYDFLLGAGWDPAEAGAVYGRALARSMTRELEQHRLATQPGLHRHLLRLAAAQDPNAPLIANLLILGFNAAHWPLWDLLRALRASSAQSVIALSKPRFFGEEIDQLWSSSWEEVTGAEAVVPEGPVEDESPAPFAGLVASYEKGEPGHVGDGSDGNLTFLVTPDLASHARAVALQAVAYLKNESCARLGIVFPEANALALEVAGHLRRLGIPLDDGTGALRPGLFERRCWQTWIACQEEPSVQRIVAWLRACEAQGVSSGLALSAREAAGVLENALGESLVDDPGFLLQLLDENPANRRAREVAAFLRARIALPDTASFGEFFTLTLRALALPGWEEHLARLQIIPPDWLREGDRKLSRKIFLAWLKEAADSRERTRSAEGNHFYGKVHLLIYAQMTGQTWTHLILTGLNEGVWPRVYETEAFGSRHELAALNQKARELNRLGTAQGGQGEGHEIVRDNRGHCLLPLERQDLALRDLGAALEATRVATCLTAMTTEAGKSLLPSDFFSHAYHAKTGRVLDEETFRLLANSGLEWTHRHERLLIPAKPLDNTAHDISATRLAYEARRDDTRPFGPYEFAFREPPPRPIQLSCKQWEDAWNHPSSVWLAEVIGVAPWPEGTLAWSRAVGTWVHRWLMTALKTCRENNSVEHFSNSLRAAADREAQRVRDHARTAGVELYPWWNLVWTQARSIALGLGEPLAPLLPDWRILSEFRLPRDILIALPGTEQKDFALTGRLDLLLLKSGPAACDPDHGDFTGCACWVIDFKTGSASSLSLKKIAQGTGLQPLLYALAVRAQGAAATSVSLHTFGEILKEQIDLDDALGQPDLFRSLDLFHRAGIFGMRADAPGGYGYAPAHPIATRMVPSRVLDAKWALVHGAGPVGGEGSE